MGGLPPSFQLRNNEQSGIVFDVGYLILGFVKTYVSTSFNFYTKIVVLYTEYIFYILYV